MAKRKLPMNKAERERYADNDELKKVRQDIRHHIKYEETPVPAVLKNRLKELKFKRKFQGMYNRAVAVGEVPWA